MMQPVVWYTTCRCAELVGQECSGQWQEQQRPSVCDKVVVTGDGGLPDRVT